MSDFTQDYRTIRIVTPLGKDVLLLQSFAGREAISELFQFDLQLHSQNRAVSFDSIVGKNVTIQIIREDGSERYLNGVISSFMQGGATQTLAQYRATLVPWLWLLTRTRDCRIFQHMTVPDIIQKIFEEGHFADFKNKLHGTYREREYCVQYRETSFEFVSRLMEEEGIFYFFEHEEDKHTLVLADSPAEFKPCPNQPSARYESELGSGRTEEVVTNWSIGQEVRPGKYSVVDFDFEKPALDLTSSVDGADARHYEIYDYPGEYKTKDEGEQLVGVRMQEQEATRLAVAGASTCRAFLPGFRFDLQEHYRRDLNRAYVLTSVEHAADAGSNYESDDAGALDYTNRFQCVPHPTPFRPPRTTRVPVVPGTQTAIVVGPSGEEIYVDKYGRVKVQFHWDREGKYDERSSCWVRVSQNWAGKRWGAMFIPRIGQEVIVDFIEGDPDRPLITGRVYNGASMPPYALPDEKTKSTVKTYSSKGGGGFNELRFEDKKGEEQIFIHAERNEDIRVEKDLLEWVGQDTHLIVKRDQLEQIDGDKHQKVTGDHNEQVDGTVSLKAGVDLQEKVGSKYALDAGTEIHLKGGTNVVVESGTTLTLKVGGNFININSGGIFIKGTMVFINSGGAAGSGSGASPEAPTAPQEADKADPGQAEEKPPLKRPGMPVIYSPAALRLVEASQCGMPFT